MKLNKKEIVKMITVIKAQCPEVLQYKNSTELEMMVDIWFDILNEHNSELVWAAVKNALKNSVYQKQNWIGVICREIEQLKAINERSDTELWADLVAILNKVRRLMYFGFKSYIDNGKRIEPIKEVKIIYEEMTPVLKSYIGGITELISLSQEDSLDFEKGRFLKSISYLREREKIKKRIPSTLTELLDEVSQATVIADTGYLPDGKMCDCYKGDNG